MPTTPTSKSYYLGLAFLAIGLAGLLAGCEAEAAGSTKLTTTNAAMAAPSNPINLAGVAASAGTASTFLRSDAQFAISTPTCTSGQGLTSTDGLHVTCVNITVTTDQTLLGTGTSGNPLTLNLGKFNTWTNFQRFAPDPGTSNDVPAEFKNTDNTQPAGHPLHGAVRFMPQAFDPDFPDNGEIWVTASGAKMHVGGSNISLGSAGGPAGGDLGGTYPNPTITQVTSAFSTRRVGIIYPTATNGTAASTWGIQTPTVIGATGSASAQATRNCISYSTAAAIINSPGGISGPVTETRSGYQNKITFYTIMDSGANGNETSAQQWWGLSSASLVNLTPSIGSTASGIHFTAVAYNTAVSPNWLFCTGDGTNFSCTDLGVATPVATTYVRVTLDWTTRASPTVKIDTSPYDTNNYSTVVATTTKSSNVTASTTQALGVNFTILTLRNAFENMYLCKMILEQN